MAQSTRVFRGIIFVPPFSQMYDFVVFMLSYILYIYKYIYLYVFDVSKMKRLLLLSFIRQVGKLLHIIHNTNSCGSTLPSVFHQSTSFVK